MHLSVFCSLNISLTALLESIKLSILKHLPIMLFIMLAYLTQA